MAKRNASGPPAAVGGSSLLVIFAVLCLTVFALLTLSTAAADGRLSQEAADAVEAYYQADSQAEALWARLRAGERPEEVTETAEDAGSTLYEYTVPVSQGQELRVSLRLEDGIWTVVQWQAVSTADWQADEDLTVWDGE
ncbi:MAG: hypothetical protein Q3X94_04255 [Oscillospiraceae bacterium]|nr:hypothetical protein [Oscillospiraceae bacterium]